MLILWCNIYISSECSCTIFNLFTLGPHSVTCYDEFNIFNLTISFVCTASQYFCDNCLDNIIIWKNYEISRLTMLGFFSLEHVIVEYVTIHPWHKGDGNVLFLTHLHFKFPFVHCEFSIDHEISLWNRHKITSTFPPRL